MENKWKNYDSLSAMLAFEQGELDREPALELFQYLVDTGLAWKLQGFYGRTAAVLINEGLIEAPNGGRH